MMPAWCGLIPVDVVVWLLGRTEVDAAVPDVAAVHLDAAVDDTPVAPEADSASHAMLHNLATAFRTMPPEQLGGVLDILLRGNHVQPDDAGEIEIELEALSSDTVHELHQYVMVWWPGAPLRRVWNSPSCAGVCACVCACVFACVRMCIVRVHAPCCLRRYSTWLLCWWVVRSLLRHLHYQGLTNSEDHP